MPARAVADNHLHLYMDKDRATALQFKLRAGGGTKKGEGFTEDARSNLLVEMAAARGVLAEEQYLFALTTPCTWMSGGQC